MKRQSLISLITLTSGFLGFLALSTFTFIGCGGGGSSSSTTTTSDDTDDVTEETLQSLSNVPDINLDNLDVTSQTGSALKIAGLASAALQAALVDNDSTAFSRAGCEYRQMMDEVKFITADVQSNICVIKALEAADIGISVPDSGCNYYNMTIPMIFEEGSEETIDESTVESTETTFSVKVRICFNDAQLTLSLCDNETGSDVQTMWFDMAAVDGKFNGCLTDIFPSYQDPTITEGFHVCVDLPNRESLAEYVEGDEGSIIAQFNGAWGNGEMGLTTLVGENIVTGAFQSTCAEAIGDCGDFTGRVYTKANPDGGCSQFAASGTYPSWDTCDTLGEEGCQELVLAGIADSQSDPVCFKPCEVTEGQEPSFTDCVEAADSDGNCTFEDTGTECFTFSKDSDETLHYYTYDVDQANADATIVSYHTMVSAQDLSAHEAPTIAFASDQVWDCSASGAFTEIDLSNPDNIAALSSMEACFAKVDGQDDAREQEVCHDQEGEDNIEKEVSGGEIDSQQGVYGGGSDTSDNVGQECSTDADCEDGLRCDTSFFTCSKPCRNDDDCSEGSFDDLNTLFACSESGFCQSTGEDNPNTEADQSCSSDDDCIHILGQAGVAANAVCNEGQCMVGCEGNASVCTEVSQAFGQNFSCTAIPGAGNFCVPQ